MPGPRHGWLVMKDSGNTVFEVINHARTAAYLANPNITIDGIEICSILEFGGCETYAWIPTCDTPEWQELTFDTPQTDDAPWWNADYSESAGALGFFIEEWTGLDDRHVTRTMTRTGRDRGGATPGSISNRERVMKLNILLLANTEESMSYLFRWFAALLESVCSSCSSNSILIRDYCGSADEPENGVRELRNVALIEGLGWEADPVRRGQCFLRRASFTIAAGDPCMYLPGTSPTVTPGTSDLGPGLLDANYSLTRSPARPSCSELPDDTRQTYTWPSETMMGAKAPIIIFHNNDPEHAFPFRAILYHDPGEIGVSPNPCGLGRLGEIYVRPMPPYSYLKWDVAAREIMYRDPTTGIWIEGPFLIEVNDAPLPRYFVLPCGGDHHLVLEPGTLAIERIGGTGNVFEWNSIIFSDPHFPDVEITVQERVSCS